jgi:hypothetical protein
MMQSKENRVYSKSGAFISTFLWHLSESVDAYKFLVQRDIQYRARVAEGSVKEMKLDILWFATQSGFEAVCCYF